MRSRRPTPQQQDIVSRRLAHLSEQLSLVPQSGDEAAEPLVVGGEWWADHTRVAEPRPALRVVTPAPVPAVVEPEPLPDPPGRHAARRRFGWADAVPDTLRGRASLGPGSLAVISVLVALGLAYTCWRVVRGDPEPPVPVSAVTTAGEAPPPLVSSSQAVAVAPAAPSASDETTTVTVDVAGKVRRPGIVVLPAGSRVVDAVEQAGGPRAGVALTSLNLARLLVDGEQIVVGGAGGAAPVVPPVVPGASAGAAPAQPGALVDLNLATQGELEMLPGIGPVTALAIIAWREEHGRFSAVNELLEVSGIGDVTLAQLTPLVTV